MLRPVDLFAARWALTVGAPMILLVQTMCSPLTAQVTRVECIEADTVELEVTSDEPFPVRNALTELRIGDVVSRISRYPDGGDLHTLIFTLARDQLESVSSDAEAVVQYNPSNLHDVWSVTGLNLAGICEPSARPAVAEQSSRR